METNIIKTPTGCPITLALEVFGDKWTLLVLRDLMFRGCYRYGELLAMPEGISTNILANRLKRLELHGIISKQADPDNYRSAIYEPTEKGIDLLPIILDIICWGASYFDGAVVDRTFVARLNSERDQVIKELSQKLHARIRLDSMTI